MTCLAGPSTLAERLLCKRRERGLTQQQLAAMVGSTYSAIQKIESGHSRRPRITNQLAKALGVNPSWLLYGEGGGNELETEAGELARAWSALPEPYRSYIFAKVYFYGKRTGVS